MSQFMESLWFFVDMEYFKKNKFKHWNASIDDFSRIELMLKVYFSEIFSNSQFMLDSSFQMHNIWLFKRNFDLHVV